MEKITWIYESSDKGKTIYRRPFGKLEPRELVSKSPPKREELVKRFKFIKG
jgi:hypothetical protein